MAYDYAMYWGEPPLELREQAPIDWTELTDDMLAEFTAILDAARDEKPLQQFFERHPAVLIGSTTAPHTSWAFPRPRLPKPEGTFWVPDFMVCDWTSLGPQWTIVELESPTLDRTNKGGVSAACSKAVQQVNDYRRHLREHANLVREGGFPGIQGHCDGLVVIGRREESLGQLDADRLAEFRGQRVEIASYDRLVDRFSQLLGFRNHQREDVRRLKDKLKTDPR